MGDDSSAGSEHGGKSGGAASAGSYGRASWGVTAGTSQGWSWGADADTSASGGVLLLPDKALQQGAGQ
jgi:hypothetical protein